MSGQIQLINVSWQICLPSLTASIGVRPEHNRVEEVHTEFLTGDVPPL